MVKADYAKWMLEDPRVNFAISRRGEQRGVDHLGLQVDDPSELREISDRLDGAGRSSMTAAKRIAVTPAPTRRGSETLKA